MKIYITLLLLAPVLTFEEKPFLPQDCSDIHRQNTTQPSGVYTIYPIGATSCVEVYCDMTSQGGRWTVFQKRVDGMVNFYQPWDRYKMGFGSAAGEYWLETVQVPCQRVEWKAPNLPPGRLRQKLHI